MSKASPEQPAPSRWSRWLLLLVLVLLVSVFYLLGLQRYFSLAYVHEHLDGWKQQAQEHQLLALLLFFGIYVMVTGLSIPVATALSLVVGYLFGRWVGTALVLVAATLGATLAFLSSRYLFRSAVQRRFGTRLGALDRGIQREGAYYLLTLRLVPYVPFFLINLGMGLTPMRVRTFAWVTFIGMLPGTFVYVNAGQAAGEIRSFSDILTPPILIAFILLGGLPLLLKTLLPRCKEEPTA